MNVKEKQQYTAPLVLEKFEMHPLNVLASASGELQDRVEEGDPDTFGEVAYPSYS